MNPKSNPGGESPGAAGAHNAAVLLGHVTKHVPDVGKQLAAVGTTVNAGSVQIKFGLGAERRGAVEAVSPGANGKVAG